MPGTWQVRRRLHPPSPEPPGRQAAVHSTATWARGMKVNWRMRQRRFPQRMGRSGQGRQAPARCHPSILAALPDPLMQVTWPSGSPATVVPPPGADPPVSPERGTRHRSSDLPELIRRRRSRVGSARTPRLTPARGGRPREQSGCWLMALLQRTTAMRARPGEVT